VADTLVTLEDIDEGEASAAFPPPRRPRRRGNPRARWILRLVAIGYVGFLVAWPLGLIVKETFANGFDALSATLGDANVRHALVLTFEVAIITVVLNVLFGVGVSLLLVRYWFPGRRIFSALIDLPLAVSPVVVGLALLLVYSPRTGWFGPALSDHGIDVIFAMPGIIIATVFVSLPLVVREVVPVLEEIGTDQDMAARSLGARSWQTFRRITFPSIRWAVVYGAVLAFARSLGEFGAVKVVSGNLVGKTQTATLLVEQEYGNFHQDIAYATSFILAFASILCIIVVGVIRPRREKGHR
jgi:sulfate/thiosulfate transport system permease protein